MTPVFYVYTLRDPRTGAIFYVGKGKGARLEAHEREARAGRHSRKCDTIRAIWADGLQVIRTIERRFFEEEEAFECEIDMIANIGLANLTNVMPGGQGRAAPNAMTPEQIKARYKEQRLKPRIERLARRYFAAAIFPAEKRGALMGRAYVAVVGELAGLGNAEQWVPDRSPFTVLGKTYEGPNALEVLLEIATCADADRGTRMQAAVALSDYCRPLVVA